MQRAKKSPELCLHAPIGGFWRLLGSFLEVTSLMPPCHSWCNFLGFVQRTVLLNRFGRLPCAVQGR